MPPHWAKAHCARLPLSSLCSADAEQWAGEGAKPCPVGQSPGRAGARALRARRQRLTGASAAQLTQGSGDWGVILANPLLVARAKPGMSRGSACVDATAHRPRAAWLTPSSGGGRGGRRALCRSPPGEALDGPGHSVRWCHCPHAAWLTPSSEEGRVQCSSPPDETGMGLQLTDLSVSWPARCTAPLSACALALRRGSGDLLSSSGPLPVGQRQRPQVHVQHVCRKPCPVLPNLPPHPPPLPRARWDCVSIASGPGAQQ